MSWLCPITFWSDDCLSHGIMFWVGMVGIGLTIFLYLKEKLIQKIKDKDKEKE